MRLKDYKINFKIKFIFISKNYYINDEKKFELKLYI